MSVCARVYVWCVLVTLPACLRTVWTTVLILNPSNTQQLFGLLLVSPSISVLSHTLKQTHTHTNVSLLSMSRVYAVYSLSCNFCLYVYVCTVNNTAPSLKGMSLTARDTARDTASLMLGTFSMSCCHSLIHTVYSQAAFYPVIHFTVNKT